MSATATALDATARRQFHRDGYLILRSQADAAQLQAMRAAVQADLDAARSPIEYEADVHYPGAPLTRSAPGGDTPRRLLQAYDRHPALRRWARTPAVIDAVASLLASPKLRLTRNHHNCVMTKHPGFSSATLWHQDVRYWSFTRPELINAWLALGSETPDNGCMWLLPGTHNMAFDSAQLDADRFLRPEPAANRALIDTARPAELAPGDLLLFHAQTFHAAGRNRSQALKLSAVFTYHAADNPPLPGTRSSRRAEVELQARASAAPVRN